MSYKISLRNHQKTQAICVLGMLGSVSAGKTSLCEKLAKNKIPKTKEEAINQSTRKIGYINIKIYGNSSNTFLINPIIIPDDYILLRHFSIADNPGHNSLMTTLIAGTAPINSALLVISCNEGIVPQTYQHIKCFKCTDIKDISIIISKVDLAKTEEQLKDLLSKIDTFMEEELTEDIDPPIIPLSSFTNINMDLLTRLLMSRKYATNISDTIHQDFDMTIIRSFDINKPGTTIDNLKGAVIGGAIKSGYIAKDDIILILPGIISYDSNNNINYTPLLTQVVNIQSNEFTLDVAIPGGFIAIETTLDPSIGKSDKLRGNIIKKIQSFNDINDHNIKCYNNIVLKDIIYLIKDYKFIDKEKYMLACHASCHEATLQELSQMNFITNAPFYINKNDKIAIIKKYMNDTKIIAYGIVESISKQSNLIIKEQEDYENFYNVQSKKQQIKSVEFINDLDDENIDNYKFADVETLIKELNYTQLHFHVKCSSINLLLNTTSFTIKNSSDIFKNFTNDKDIIILKSLDFSEYIKEQYKSELSNSKAIVNSDSISFVNVKRALRKFFIPELNKHLEAFIIKNFTCTTCKAIGSMMYEKKSHYCRACNAISMEKK